MSFYLRIHYKIKKIYKFNFLRSVFLFKKKYI